jgi:hypothetical protein
MADYDYIVIAITGTEALHEALHNTYYYRVPAIFPIASTRASAKYPT